MITTILIIIYVLGCVLTYGRLKAQSVEMEELCGGYEFNLDSTDYLFVSFSFIAFIGTVIVYFKDGDKYFLKFRRC